jgi:hypothetical protein
VLLYVIQLDGVCHRDGNTHTCLYLGALAAGSQALMLPCKEKHSLRFYNRTSPTELQNILNEEAEEQLIIPILLK